MAFEGIPVSLIPRVSVLLTAALTMALAPSANAGGLDAAVRAEVEGLREGEMRKLTVHAEPRAAGTAAFLDRQGVAHTLAESDGKVRLVNFWATWCAPCRVEKPSLDALAVDMSGSDFEVIAIATGRHTFEAIDRFNADVGVEHLATYLDESNALAMEMAVPGLPVTVVLDRDGSEVARLMGGADWDTESARAILEAIIGAED
jgi:thiol-disulfide isomerase/thioredoxin